MTNITESTGPPSGPLPRKGDRQTRIRNMRTMRLRRALIRTAAPREILSTKTISIFRPSCAARPVERNSARSARCKMRNSRSLKSGKTLHASERIAGLRR